MITNQLERARGVAKAFLSLDVQKTSVSGIVSHPFTNTNLVALTCEDGSLTIGDIWKDDDRDRWIQSRCEAIDCSDVTGIMMMINPPYRLLYLKLCMKLLSSKEVGELLKSFWTSIECISKDINVSSEDIINLFNYADKNYLMSKDERRQIDKLPDTIELYRGVTDYNRDEKMAVSYTDSLKVATFFARRFNQDGYVWRITVPKSSVLALFDSGEREFILDLTKFDTKQIIEVKI